MSARAMAAAIRERLRDARYVVDDVGYQLGRLPRALGRSEDGGREERAPETGRPGHAMRLIVAGVPVLGLIAVVLAVLLSGDGSETPPDDAIGLVPADALAYVHVDLDPDSEQYRQLAAVAGRVPQVSRQVVRLVSAPIVPEGGSVGIENGPPPWAGSELALALLPGGRGRVEPVQLLEVADEEGAREAGGAGAEIVDGFLVIGADTAVDAVSETAASAGGTAALDDEPAAADARELLPDERVADAFLSEAGVDELVANPRSALSTLEPFVDAGATRGAAAALVAADDGLELVLRSDLDPERSETDPGFFSAFPPFEPTLDTEVSADALAYVGFGAPGEVVSELLSQASVEAPGLAAGVSDLLGRLRALGELSLEDDLEAALGEEAAVALELGRERLRPGAQGSESLVPLPELPGQPPPAASSVPAPFGELVVGGVDEERARRAVGRLGRLLAGGLRTEPSGPVAPVERSEIDGVDVRTVELSPGTALTYAVFDSKLVAATSPEGIERIVAGEDGLDAGEAFRRATEGLPDEPSLLAYLQLSGLLELAERQGLAEDPAYAALAEELHRLRALAVGVEADEDELSTDVRLLIGDRGR